MIKMTTKREIWIEESKMTWLDKIKKRFAHSRPFITYFPRFHCMGAEAGCGNIRASWRRQNTAYYIEKLNWVYLCDECNQINNEYWKEMWSEYWSQVI